jgi:hypothetical protein
MNKKPSYNKLLKERERLLKKLADCPSVLRGSLRKHGNKCGNPGCRCKDPKNPVLHGPYHYLSHRYESKTQTIFLSKAKLEQARQWTANYKRLIKVLYRLSEINFRILRWHYDKLDREGTTHNREEET